MSLSRTTDFIYALRIITLLTTPWEKQAAFKVGIIDKDGNLLKKSRDLKTSEEKDAYTYLHRMIFNMKRLLQTIPGGKSWLAAATASFLLLKENLEELNLSDDEWRMIEEAFYAMEDTPANIAGDGVETNTEKHLAGKMVRRKKKDEI